MYVNKKHSFYFLIRSFLKSLMVFINEKTCCKEKDLRILSVGGVTSALLICDSLSASVLYILNEAATHNLFASEIKLHNCFGMKIYI